MFLISNLINSVKGPYPIVIGQSFELNLICIRMKNYKYYIGCSV